MTGIKTLSVRRYFGSFSYSPSADAKGLINSLDKETRDQLEKRIRSELERTLAFISIELALISIELMAAADRTSSDNHNNHAEDVEDAIWDYPDPPTTSVAEKPNLADEE